MAKLHTSICINIFKSIHYLTTASFVITSTILLNILNAVRKILNSINCIITAALCMRLNRLLQGKLSVSLVSLANRLHLHQLCPYIFVKCLSILSGPWVEAKFPLHQSYQEDATHHYHQEHMYLLTFLIAVLRKELSRTFPNLCLTLM